MAKTIHVYPATGGWAVKRAGPKTPSSLFATQKEAVSKARSLAASGQMVVYGKDGSIRKFVSFGIPRIQNPPGKRAVNIEKAVGRVALERFASDPHPPSGYNQ